MSDILNIKKLNKSFGRHKVLTNLELDLGTGKVYGLLGINGVGKTTLIRIIMGIIPADSGEILFKNQKIRFSDAAYKKEIGYIPEESIFYGNMRVNDFLHLTASFYSNWNGSKAEEFLKRFSLDKKARIENLSRGHKLKLGFLMALATEPVLLILDDPTSGIDVPTRQDFLKDIIQELTEAGTTILFASHLVHELEKIIDRFGILHEGRIILDEEYSKVKSQMRRVRIFRDDSWGEKFKADEILKMKITRDQCECIIYPWNEEIEKKINELNPRHLEIEPLSLEEIFMNFVSKRPED